MANQQEVIQKIGELKAQVSSIGAQIVAKVGELEAAVAAGQDTTPIMDALTDFGTTLQGVDDLVPDLPPAVPPPAEPEG